MFNHRKISSHIFSPGLLTFFVASKALSTVPRRSLVFAPLVIPLAARADVPIVSGVVSLTDSPPLPETAALYVTVKRGAAPQAVVGLVRGAPAPPLGAVRIAKPSFPCDFKITKADLFPEFQDIDLTGQALTVSARLDSDGQAATRSPDDLVASTFINSPSDVATLELRGRGFVSKLMK